MTTERWDRRTFIKQGAAFTGAALLGLGADGIGSPAKRPARHRRRASSSASSMGEEVAR